MTFMKSEVNEKNEKFNDKPYRVRDTVSNHLCHEIRSLNMRFSSLQQFSKPRKIIVMMITRNSNRDTRS